MLIQPPKNCPSCDSLLHIEKDQLFCRNSECPAKQSKIVENFAKKIKLKGLGPKAIEKLSLASILDIYIIGLSKIENSLGQTLAKKLYLEIEKSKKISLNTLLPALNIRLIGESASEKICSVITHVTDISEETCKLAGLGPLATKNLLGYFETNDEWKYLPFSWKAEKPKIYSKTVCISGRLKSFKTKALATVALEEAGYKVSTTLNKTVDILINESDVESSKTVKATEMGIKIVNNLTQLL